MIIFDPKSSIKGMASHIPVTSGNCYAKQIDQTFQVKGSKAIGNPGDYLVRMGEKLLLMPKDVFEEKWKLFWNPR
jgi:hypothetical protein